jgi:nucleotide-binding universal stress UspA family protein
MNAPVLVGVDGSAAALSAVGFAAQEAALRKRPLRIVYVCQWPSVQFAIGALPEDLRMEGDQILGLARAQAQTRAPGVEIRTSVAAGDAAAILVEEAERAVQVVLGGRGRDGFTELLLGSVAHRVAARAAVPVLVVRGTPAAGGAVVLGIDGSPANEPAVGFAFDEASRRRAPLVAVHAWTHPVDSGTGGLLFPMYDLTLTAQDETRLLFEALAGWREKYPDVEVRPIVERTSARHALTLRSQHARLVVLGRTGHGGLVRWALGPVTSSLLHHASCPVAVVPSR